MASRRKREKRGMRVNREEVKNRARENRQGRGTSTINLPDGKSVWYPEEKGTVRMDIIGYIVSCNNHPDGVEKGEFHYRRPYKVHFNVGPDNAMVVCPTSVGKPCPICEEVKKLKEDYDENVKQITDIQAKKMCLFNVMLEDEDEIKIFDFSAAKFANKLEVELDEGELDICGFFDIVDGRTLKVRFLEETYKGRKFISADKIDFLERDDLDEEILDQVVDLDTILKVKPYDDIKKLFYGLEDEEEDAANIVNNDDTYEDDEEEEEVKPKKKKTSKAKSKKRIKDEEDEEEEDDIDFGEDEEFDEEEEEEVKPKKTRKTKSKKKTTVKEEDEEEDDDIPFDFDEDEEEVDFDEEEEEEEEVKPKKKKTSKAKSKKRIEEDDEDEDDDIDFDFDLEDEEVE